LREATNAFRQLITRPFSRPIRAIHNRPPAASPVGTIGSHRTAPLSQSMRSTPTSWEPLNVARILCSSAHSIGIRAYGGDRLSPAVGTPRLGGLVTMILQRGPPPPPRPTFLAHSKQDDPVPMSLVAPRKARAIDYAHRHYEQPDMPIQVTSAGNTD